MDDAIQMDIHLQEGGILRVTFSDYRVFLAGSIRGMKKKGARFGAKLAQSWASQTFRNISRM